MPGFYKAPSDGWPAVAAALPKPWPAAAVDHDLEWHASEARAGRREYRHTSRTAGGAVVPLELPFPTFAELAERWGWTKAKVGRYVDADRWCVRRDRDAIETQARRYDDQESLNHADRQATETEKRDVSETLVRRDRARARVQEKKKQKQNSKGTPEWRAACDLWDEHLGRAVGTSQERLTPSSGTGREIGRLAKVPAEDLALVLRWLRESPECVMRRDGGWHRKAATVAAHLDDYLTGAHDWAAKPDAGPWEVVWRVLEDPSRAQEITAGLDPFVGRCVRSAANQLRSLGGRDRDGQAAEAIRAEMVRRISRREW